ncbi:hypothetical protein A8924_1854 [Saccharopolyspora erythraea NRRL 2338]|nr:hypothetical protein [Saccharopolyspora erythraea]PFG94566.1 hypothetical protein A8924_1854 [Saccharopolyspora erythraea NRRL 2338]
MSGECSQAPAAPSGGGAVVTSAALGRVRGRRVSRKELESAS